MNTNTNMNSVTVDTLFAMLSVIDRRFSSSETPSFCSNQFIPPANMKPPSNGYAGSALDMPRSRSNQKIQYSMDRITQKTSPKGVSYHHLTSSEMGSNPLNGPERYENMLVTCDQASVAP